MSSVPPATCSKYGFERSYIACPATEATVQRCAGCIAVTSHVVRGDLAQHRLLAAVRLGAERRAFEHLAEVVRLVLGKAVMDRRRGEHAAVAAAPADDHVRALLQQLDERMHAGHRDDALGRVELGLGQRACAVEPRDRLAGAHAPPQVFLARPPNRSSRA